MGIETVRYTATLPLAYIAALKEMAREKEIPSINFAISQALDEYLKNRRAEQFDANMALAANDKAFIERTMSCAEDFKYVDSEIYGSW